MIKVLALDIGGKHTGAAYADTDVDVALPLDTIDHEDEEGLVAFVAELVKKRGINIIVVGRPVFMSGGESEQTRFTECVADLIKADCPQCRMEYVDERGTSSATQNQKSSDPHAQAAVSILRIFLERKRF